MFKSEEIGVVIKSNGRKFKKILTLQQRCVTVSCCLLLLADEINTASETNHCERPEKNTKESNCQ